MPDEVAAKAACKGQVTALRDPWHPAGRAQAPALYAVARRVCDKCPVLEACLGYGLDLLETTGQVEGMYGGLTPAELRRHARELGRPTRKIAQHGTRARYVSWKCRCVPCQAANARYKAAQDRAS